MTDSSSTPGLPPDSLQARIERDNQGEFIAAVMSDFAQRRQKFADLQEQADVALAQRYEALQQTLGAATQSVQRVWQMYHGEA